MWPFHGFPLAKANGALNTKLDQAWLDKVRTATVRLSNCTASFVSKDGLILTNHHCVEACLAEHSSKEKSYVEDGFLAKSREEEKKCQTQIADVLTGMEDITAKVAQATEGKDDKAANDARKAALTQLESRVREDGRSSSARASTSTRAASTGSTSTSATPTCASCSRPRPASRRSAATRTTSSSRAGASTWASCAPTRTASRRSPLTT